jgi:polysaccharide deacetylase family protein (PEP-CTERM system associated)
MGKKLIINALSFDVEEWFQNINMEEYLQRSLWDTFESRIEKNMEPILRLLEARKTLATFFVLGWVAQRHPDLIKRIAAQGHEIATHGWSHTRAYQQEPAEFEVELKQAINILKEITGQPVLGHRAACFSITSNSHWVIDILIRNGIMYDSSIYPIVHDRYGMARSPRFPYVLKQEKGRRLSEFPLSTYKFLDINLPIAGGGYFRLYPYALTRWFIDRLNRQGHPVMVYLHPPEFDMEHPKINMDPINKFRACVGIKNNFNKLKQLLEDFKFAPAKEVLSLNIPT